MCVYVCVCPSTILSWGLNFHHLNLDRCPTAEDHQEHTCSQQGWVYHLLHKAHGAPCRSLRHLRQKLVGEACYKQEFALG